ncbi:uncharacterized protein K452DRAFT_263960 [Aplosporella prunicola CBS 121167]|uniref:DNA polymerase n=1 Tax=Aplosporella prunicola CBS 121167 TaxID=1176127 RepID=A0A6A6BR71_9PEZI|nr:uncharacterized protein K452DRAFT_263960 [Aplosporella prunicola CBS 121167]KAF2146268.1 hypothetical protein K452DRAFT_263960 [Aplosporella prunicola CBS 121167]
MSFFRFRLDCLDHYESTPTELDPQLHRSLGQTSYTVPVIRVFGATETGQRVCAHIHGALPYLYLEYDGSLEQKAVDSYVHSLRISIDHALAASYRRHAYDKRSCFVGHISLVKGVPFFGYHVGYRFFLKIYMLNPLHMTRLADLLHQGAILAKVMQPYESHLQYLLQWMCDYNLYGCAYIDCAKVRFRSPVPEYLCLSNPAHKWHDKSIRPEWLSEEDQFPRQSHCAIEVDLCVQDIMNRNDVRSRPLHHDFMERFNSFAPDEKLVHSMASLWRDETIRRKRRMGIKDPSSSPFPPEVLLPMSADSRNLKESGWIHEEEYRKILEQLVMDERDMGDGNNVSFDRFLKPGAVGNNVKTALESVEDLFPEKLGEFYATQRPPSPNLAFNNDTTSQHAISQDKACSDETAFGDQPQVLEEKIEVEPQNGMGSPLQSNGESGKFLNHIDQKRGATVVTNKPRKRANFSAQPLSQPSQSSIKAHGNRGPNTLSFPVIKNAHDSETASRLAHRSGWSNSQQTESALKSTPFWHSKNMLHSSVRDDHPEYSAASCEPPTPPQILHMAVELSRSFNVDSKTDILYFSQLPPSAEMVDRTILEYGKPPVIYQEAYYSDEKDVPERHREYAGREFRLGSNTTPYLPPFDPIGNASTKYGGKRRKECLLLNWEIAVAPPSFKEVSNWVRGKEEREKEGKESKSPDVEAINVDLVAKQLSQVDGPTQKNKHGFKYSQKQASTNIQHETQYMSILSLEVHVNTRGSLLPDPAQDEISSIFWCFQADDQENEGPQMGVLVLSNDSGVAPQIVRQLSVDVQYEEDELSLINLLVDIVRRLDPDILIGYEVHNSSWGYLIERARVKLEYDLCTELSRMRSQAQAHDRYSKEADKWGFTHTSTIRITGRHMLNIWRAMRSELQDLLQYTVENVAFHLLHKRIPHYSHQDLTKWFQSDRPRDLAKVLNHYLSRVHINLELLEANDLISRNSEQARLLGIDFFSVFSRGSQFRVESLMFRIAKPESFVLVSPSRKQVGQQNALECLPLVMEPQSAFYNSPLLVLDFQSLYPSVMIAYNYCYSTCLGRVVGWRGQNKMGFTDFKREPRLLELVKDHINISPNGIMYVKPEMRKSLLAKMLSEILETRFMVKNGMKADKDDKAFQQLQNNRQLALKLIANVTYGYTSASFSGRMPCSEIADSIVQSGRETLEKAIALIHSVERWGAEVVYGDTDSLFVYLKGRTKDEAFDIGEEIANAVTDMNPRPIKLKFEKVYHPCVLLAKKRYAGFKYESRHQKEPEFDAKGIETVRRDGTPAGQKVVEKALKILFRSADLSVVKRYFQDQCTKIMTGKISIQDFLFAKEVKLGTYADKGSGPPGAIIASRRMLQDPRAEPQYGERVPYIVITGPPGARLVDRCVSPETLLLDEQVELDAEYYISKNLIPPLERIFNLVGANVRNWYDEMPKVQRVRNISAPSVRGLQQGAGTDGGNVLVAGQTSRRILENYMQSSACVVCRSKLAAPPPHSIALPDPPLPLCEPCATNPARALLALRQRQQRAEARIQGVEMVCRNCSGLAFGEEVRCDSRDCPVFYTRVRQRVTVRGLRLGLQGVFQALESTESMLDW